MNSPGIDSRALQSITFALTNWISPRGQWECHLSYHFELYPWFKISYHAEWYGQNLSFHLPPSTSTMGCGNLRKVAGSQGHHNSTFFFFLCTELLITSVQLHTISSLSFLVPYIMVVTHETVMEVVLFWFAHQLLYIFQFLFLSSYSIKYSLYQLNWFLIISSISTTAWGLSS